MSRTFLEPGVVFVVFCCVCQSQEVAGRKHITVPIVNGARSVLASADEISKGMGYPSSVRLSGQVEIRTPVCLPVGTDRSVVCDGDMVLRADQAVLHEDSGEIEAHGDVRVIPLQHAK
ncbi:MAG: hypothetical protein KGN84_22100 [Acidobacteriota bacterium]|nr:hypothetical protein [Acidobacteriota bacterium]